MQSLAVLLRLGYGV